MESYDHTRLMKDLLEVTRNIALMVSMVPSEDLKKAAKTIDSADAIGWVYNPSAYRDRMYDGGLTQQKAMVDFIQGVKADIPKIFPDDEYLRNMMR